MVPESGTSFRVLRSLVYLYYSYVPTLVARSTEWSHRLPLPFPSLHLLHTMSSVVPTCNFSICRKQEKKKKSQNPWVILYGYIRSTNNYYGVHMSILPPCPSSTLTFYTYSTLYILYIKLCSRFNEGTVYCIVRMYFMGFPGLHIAHKYWCLNIGYWNFKRK